MGQACECGCKHSVTAGRGDEVDAACRGSFVYDETVEGAVRRAPRAAAVLRGFGIDTCCGGGLTLTQAAASAGVPVETVLETLGAGRGT